MLKLGINTVLFKGFGIKQALKLIKLAGYDGAELSAIQGMCEHLVLDAWESQVPLIKAWAKEAGVELLSMEVASLDEERLVKAFKAGVNWSAVPVYLLVVLVLLAGATALCNRWLRRKGARIFETL